MNIIIRNKIKEKIEKSPYKDKFDMSALKDLLTNAEDIDILVKYQKIYSEFYLIKVNFIQDLEKYTINKYDIIK